jgi:hypothetical protein
MEKARNSDLMIASEQLKSMFDELRRAGFTERQALEYLSGLMAKLTFMNRMRRMKK